MKERALTEKIRRRKRDDSRINRWLALAPLRSFFLLELISQNRLALGVRRPLVLETPRRIVLGPLRCLDLVVRRAEERSQLVRHDAARWGALHTAQGEIGEDAASRSSSTLQT